MEDADDYPEHLDETIPVPSRQHGANFPANTPLPFADHSVHTSPIRSNALVQRPTFPRRASHDLFECLEVKENKRFSEEEAAFIFFQLVDILHYLDANGVTHCDVKDENILIVRDLRVRPVYLHSCSANEPPPFRLN